MKPRRPPRRSPSPNRRAAPRGDRQTSHPNGIKYLVAGSSMLAVLGLLVDLGSLFKPAQPRDICQEVVQPQSVLSRDELSQLLAIAERDSKESVRRIVREPYCIMPTVEIRAGVTADREAYPLEFDPQTWFVILYEGEEYAGYAFSFQH